VLEEIFLRLPSHLVVCVCQSVCIQWKEVIDRASFWRERCKREGYRPSDQSKIPEDWRLFYFLCKQQRNLIKNPCGEEGLNGWNIEKKGGDGWWVGPLRTEHPDKNVKKDYATSFGMCLKSQLIDLKKEGYTSSFMDTFQPDIKICDW
ncbi:hypothetical protein CHARACLAT_033156, partial [Characodon lateralis]|nr:hypothetical protein [Characodon lateralis]